MAIMDITVMVVFDGQRADNLENQENLWFARIFLSEKQCMKGTHSDRKTSNKMSWSLHYAIVIGDSQKAHNSLGTS